jgi:hypothetical protein
MSKNTEPEETVPPTSPPSPTEPEAAELGMGWLRGDWCPQPVDPEPAE